MAKSTLETRITDLGREFFASIADQKPSVFSKTRWTGQALGWCMANEHFKTQLFRFVDVYPYLTTVDMLTQHIREYFGADDDLPALFQWGARQTGVGGNLGAGLLNRAIRANIADMAKQFIIGSNASEAVRRVGRLRRRGFSCVLTVLGEATVSEDEADEYVATNVELIQALGDAQAKWEPLQGEASGSRDGDGAPMVNVSVKPTALYSQTKPANFEGSAEGTLRQMKRIYRGVIAVGGFLCIDMESRDYKDITIEVFKRLRADDEFRHYPHVGIVLQSYLTDTDRDVAELIAWARAEALPISIRLVKGAYWDFEVVNAKQKGWPIPVYLHKPETDLAFERNARRILENHDICHMGCGSHNIRSIAATMEMAREIGVPDHRYEFQVLFGMAEPVRKGLLDVVKRVRLYAPYGDMVPGMAYLVRRLLENTSNESFLRKTFAEGRDVEELLTDPQARLERELSEAADGAPEGFANHPLADFTDRETRDAFPAAIAGVRAKGAATYALHIDGEDVAVEKTIPSVNPADPSEVVGHISQAGTREVDQAVAAAKAAAGAWRDTPPGERAGCLRRAADVARRRIVELSAWQILEVGKQWDQAYGDVAEAIDFLEFYADEMEHLGAPRRLGTAPGELNESMYEPKGIAAVIAPWNFPLAISTGMTAAAIVTGNPVVYKPSNQSAAIGHHLVELLSQAGLPPGVFNYVPGSGAEIGDHLVDHPDISVIAFTGSVEVGLRINQRASVVHPGQANVKKIICEMGGKNAIIVDDDADIDEAVPIVLRSALAYQGQKCSACSRVIVLGAVYERFIERLAKAAGSMKIGPSEFPENVMGPLVDASAQRDVLEYAELAKREGHLLFESEVPKSEGYYAPITIVDGITPEDRIAQEEVFGPVLAVMRAENFDQAIAWANSTRFALTGGVISRSPAHLALAKERFRVGNLYLNRQITGALVNRQPFGGSRMSGGGTKAGGHDYLLHFMDPRVVTENTMRRGFAPVEEGDDWGG